MRRSIVLLSFYNGLIYLPLIVICICGRALMPDVQSRRRNHSAAGDLGGPRIGPAARWSAA